jgi:broad specificity phosphatase PhoE
VILLARHGETTYNAERRFQGRNDVALNERGLEQARELAALAAAREPAIVALYTSPLRRAAQTARVVGEALGLEPREDARFEEVDTGDWTERLKGDVEREDPEGWAAYLAAGEDFRFPGGESLLEQQERVIAGFVAVTQRGELPALVVCHRGVIRAARAHTDIRGLDAFHDYEVPNGALMAL